MLPQHLADVTGTIVPAAERQALWKERSEWFRAHGIDPGDWSRVYPVLQASWVAWGIEGHALARARQRSGGNPDAAQ